ncbi:hypothetical protein Patl1_30741 [Pistacia atlantica]|uniref:Uncharacterized protein n=1 Tax=Pistacia atlantica TaxID=434234 RepID=A0ACC1AAS5_9ROSI|nr:hypothetical protein Patl1_30741 [Pistacia atlantica]
MVEELKVMIFWHKSLNLNFAYVGKSSFVLLLSFSLPLCVFLVIYIFLKSYEGAIPHLLADITCREVALGVPWDKEKKSLEE